MYEEKYVRRGEIYSVRSGEHDDVSGSMTRPGLIISNNIMNSGRSNAVIVAMLTTNDNNIGIHYGPIMNTGRASYVCCERLMSVSKARLGKLMGSLSENQMEEVENRLDEVLDLGYVDNTPLREKEAECEALRLQLEELKAENAVLKKRDAAHADELLTRDVEIAVAKRMYDKAVGVIAAMRAEPDMPERPMGPPKKKSEERKPPKVNDPPKGYDERKPVDINSANFSKLRAIGFSNGVVLAVINGRPYKTVEDLKKVPGVNSRLFDIVKPRVCCIPVPEPEVVVEEPEVKVEEIPVVTEAPVVVEEPPVVTEALEVAKVNVNTASLEELMGAGLNKKTAMEIRAWRNKNGNFEKLEDLLVLKHFGNTIMKRYGHRLEV